MILEAIAITALAASSLSDAELKKAAAMVAMGRHKQLLEQLGPSEYFMLVDRLRPGERRTAAFSVLGPAYRAAAYHLWGEGGLKEVMEDREPGIYFHDNGPHGKSGAFVAVLFFVPHSELRDDESHGTYERDPPYISAARRLHRDILNEEGWRVEIFNHADVEHGDDSSYVSGTVWVSEKQLRAWANS